jgi:hypothetical protein
LEEEKVGNGAQESLLSHLQGFFFNRGINRVFVRTHYPEAEFMNVYFVEYFWA